METGFERFKTFEDALNRRAEFHKEGLKIIISYYSLPKHQREEKTGFRDPPHEIFMKRASKLIFLGLKNLEKEYPWSEAVGFILTGIGTEILLKAIILKEDPKYFINNINVDRERTLSYNRCIDKLIELFRETLTQKQAQRVKDVLSLIRQQRDNSVHLGFRWIEAHGDSYQMAHVLEFLFSYFFKKTTNDIVRELRGFKKAKKAITGMDYEPIEFPMV